LVNANNILGPVSGGYKSWRISWFIIVWVVILVSFENTVHPGTVSNTHYIITTVKHAIWLVNSLAGSGYLAQGTKMPSRDFRGILKMSLFHRRDCSYFIKLEPVGVHRIQRIFRHPEKVRPDLNFCFHLKKFHQEWDKPSIWQL
jgi:hypothetical protein